MAEIKYQQKELEDGSLVVFWADGQPEDTYEPFPFQSDYVVYKTDRCVSAAKSKEKTKS